MLFSKMRRQIEPSRRNLEVFERSSFILTLDGFLIFIVALIDNKFISVTIEILFIDLCNR